MQYTENIKQPELPFKPFTKSHTGPNFKASKTSYQQWVNHRGGEGGRGRRRRGGRVKRKGRRRESVQHMEGRTGHKTGEDG